MPADILYLSETDVTAVLPTPDEARRAVIDAFTALHAGRATTKPKLALPLGPGHVFQAMAAADADAGVGGIKWLGMAPADRQKGGPTIHAVILVNDRETGALSAILDGNAITGLRTAAMSAAAASFLARPDSHSIGFVGAGLQARTHLEAMRALFPSLTRATCYSRTIRSAEAFAALARDTGLDARAASEPAEAIRDHDIVVTTVPMAAGFEPFLDPAWIAPGAFVAAVDVGRSWLPKTLHTLDIKATDNHTQSAENAPISEHLGPFGSYDCDLADLCAGARPGRRRADERALFLFRGLAPADIAVAAKVLEKAIEAGVGTRLPR